MPALAHQILALTMTASGALTGNRFVGVDGATAVAAAAAYGVAQNDADDGTNVAVTTHGTELVTAGAAIAAGAAVEVGADGKAVTLAAGVQVGRLAPDAEALADGDLVEVILINS